MPLGHIVRRQAKTVEVGLDRTVQVPCSDACRGPFEVAFGLRLYVSIRFRHHVVKCLSFQMMYSYHGSHRQDFVNE